jgi:hypothetical protein
MTTRDNLIAAMKGLVPEKTPLSLYNWMMDDPTSDEWRRLLDQGLGICQHCRPIKHIEHGVKDTFEERIEGDQHYRIYRKETPVGTLRRVTLNGWHHEDWIKEPNDYKIRQWMIEHTELVPEYEEFEEADALAGDYGVPVVTGSRTPAMSINVDWAGTEQFCLDVAMGVEELFELYEAQKKLFLEETRLIAEGPGQFVKWFENLTISMLGPKRYEDLLVSVYEEAVPLLEAAGKRVMVHYDGALKVIRDEIAEAPFHIIESLTEPPEGDMTYDECRSSWPNKAFWGNINVDLYYRSEGELREAVIAKRERAGKRAFAFEISEDLPRNWKQSVPIVLETLAALD